METTMTVIQEEVHDVLMTRAELQEMEQKEKYQVAMMMEWLMPWLEKSDGDMTTMGYWQDTLATTMMMKLLELWLDENSRLRLRNLFRFYHPLDRAAMAYALVVYGMTGKKMTLRNGAAQYHYMQMLNDMKKDIRITNNER
jgi:hypothetical protein